MKCDPSFDPPANKYVCHWLVQTGKSCKVTRQTLLVTLSNDNACNEDNMLDGHDFSWPRGPHVSVSDHGRDNNVRGSSGEIRITCMRSQGQKHSLTDKTASLLRGERHSSVGVAAESQRASRSIHWFISRERRAAFSWPRRTSWRPCSCFPHGSEDHLKVYLEPVQKRQTSPVVYWGTQVVVGSRRVARAWRVQLVVLFSWDGGTPVEMVMRGVRMQG